jgi:DNA replication protein DnaC
MRGNVHVRFGGRVRRNGVRVTGPPRSAPTLHLPIDKHGADLLFQIISQRYERGSVVLTTNKAYKHWPSMFNNDSTLTSAILDRILHHAETIVIEGKSYRMKDRIEN